MRSELRMSATPFDAKKSGLTGISTRSQQVRTLYERRVNDGGQSKRTKSYFGSFSEF
jgi:acetate kinase